MSTTIVIADLHLCESAPQITECFVQFLNDEQGKHDALYILGDLFESWIGDDDQSNFNKRIAEVISSFSQTTPVYFIHGNRDFLLGRRFAAQAGMTLLPEWHEVNLYGRDVLFMHGDQLCLDDIDYQKFRKKSRTWWWKTAMLALPIKFRRKLAREYRQKSMLAQKNKSMSIMDVAPREVDRVIEESNCNWLIHGHTHRPNIHEHKSGAKRIVLGDWYEQGSILLLSEDGAKLEALPFK